MLGYKRTDRLNDLIRMEIAEILMTRVKDPRIGFVTVTAAAVSPDLRSARVFVSILGDKAAADTTLQGLRKAAPFIRGELGKRIQTRYTPELTFEHDLKAEEASRVLKLLDEISEKKQMSREKVVEAIRRHGSFYVTAHRNPEADAMGSSLALAHLLRQVGKRASVVSVDPLPRNLQFLPHEGLLRQQPALTEWPEMLFVLDCGDLERTGLVKGNPPPGSAIVNIDHHVTNRQFGAINWVDPDAAATAELIFDLVEALGAKLTTEIGLCLYTAIASETGFFAYSNTRPSTFRRAAELLERGVDPWAVAQRLRENTPERLKLLSELLGGMERSADGQIAWMTVTSELFQKTGTSAEDTEEFIGYPRSLRGVEVAVLFRQESGLTWKISLRSKNRADVARVAERFGGGGHHRAAGCTVNGSLDEVKQRVLAAVEEALGR
jgi:phosphoesterase RecJ-like protein